MKADTDGHTRTYPCRKSSCVFSIVWLGFNTEEERDDHEKRCHPKWKKKSLLRK